MSDAPDSTYIARLWEHPDLCVGIFGLQLQSDAGRRLYDQSGIQAELEEALDKASGHGMLHMRRLQSDEGPLVMVYWSSYAALDRWARSQPHSRWWKWLFDNEGNGVGFYHEIYQAKAAEALYARGTAPVGPALFTSVEAQPSGKGRSRARQQRFIEEQPG